MKVALVYDRVNKWGGAERILLALHEIFPDAPLFTSVYNPKKAPWAKVFDVKTSFLQNFPLAKSTHELYALLMPLAFENFSFDGYDLVISVTSEAAKGIITKPKTIHLCYCLTPTRYLWSGYHDYFRNPLFRVLTTPIISYLRAWDKIASTRPDFYIAISKEVQERIKKYYNRYSEVVYPPLTFSAEVGNNPVRRVIASPRQDGYFLVVSRLVPYKRIDIAIEAFNKLKLPLKIIGSGVEKQRLKNMAGPTIEFLGNLTDKQLVSYYRDCIALVFPSLEDFGLTVLEAQSFGKPVIAFRGGGALETVIEGKTGEFFYPQTAEGLINKLKKFNHSRYNKKDCLEQANKFNKERFKNDFFLLIEELISRKK